MSLDRHVVDRSDGSAPLLLPAAGLARSVRTPSLRAKEPSRRASARRAHRVRGADAKPGSLRGADAPIPRLFVGGGAVVSAPYMVGLLNKQLKTPHQALFAGVR